MKFSVIRDSVKLKALPDSPGVYLMKDKAGNIIYIGKALSLKKRVSSYFTKAGSSFKTSVLVSNIKDIDYIPADSEEEALLLESALVRQKQPKYNILLKDDKRYPLLKLTLSEKFPQLAIVRRKKDDGALYFGPYTSGKLLRRALAIIQRIFILRLCKTMPKTACLNYDIGLCIAPCIKNIDEKGYKQIVDDLILFLEGRKKELVESLSGRMEKAASAKNFEEAARLRDQIEALSALSTKKGSGKSYFSQLQELQAVLKLEKPPVKIEAFDISDISGSEAVGSMVSFFAGQPDKANYRRFKIRSVFEIDDYKMIEEVVRRRYSRVLNENIALPDLVIIDGGKGHVSIAKKVLNELNLGSVSVIGIAKKEEEIFLPNKVMPVKLGRDSRALQLIQKVRDEAHRFAQSYHHILRRKKVIGK